MGGDPVPQALLITGIVVAFSATALAVALLLRLFDETGSVTLSPTHRPAQAGQTRCAIEAAHDAAGSSSMLTTPGGLLLLLAVLVPVRRRAAGLVLGGRNAQRVAMLTMRSSGSPWRSPSRWRCCSPATRVVYLLGGWAPPLGIALRADGLSVVMMLAVAVVICGIGVYARADFGTPAGAPRSARAVRVLAAAAGGVGLAQPGVRQRRPVHAVRRARAADVRRRAAGLPRRQRRDAARRAALPAVRAGRLAALPAGRRAAVRRLRHAGHRAAGRSACGPSPSPGPPRR